MTKQILSRGT